MAQDNPLLPLVRRYVETDAQSAARLLETMDEEDAAAVLAELPPNVTAKTFAHLQTAYCAALLKTAGPEHFAAVCRQLDPERAARVFLHLPQEVRERFVPHLPERLRANVQEHLRYPKDSVGQIMSPNFLSFRENSTVKEAVGRLRAQAKKRITHSYAYVVDADGHMVGVLNMHELLVATSSQTLSSVMAKDAFALDAFMDRTQAAEELRKRRFFAAPVVDTQNKLLGVIRAEQMLEGVKQEVSEDIQKIFGVSAEERAFSPLGISLRRRLPWLHVNLVTAFMAAAVVGMFEGVIAKVTALAVLLPVVAGQGGNAGAQSLGVVMRGLVMREIPAGRARALIIKEGLLGTVSGTVTGLVTGLVAWLWFGNAYLGLVISMGMLVNLCCAGIAGASIPLLLKKLGLDPVQSSNILLTTVTDVVGFFAFLGFALLFQNQLV